MDNPKRMTLFFPNTPFPSHDNIPHSFFHLLPLRVRHAPLPLFPPAASLGQSESGREGGESGGGGGGGGVCPRGRERGERGGASGDFASPYYTLLYFGRGGISTMVQK